MIIEAVDLHLSDISFLVTRQDGRKVDFSKLVTQYVWSDHVNIAGAEVSLEAEGTADLVNQIGLEGSTAMVVASLPDVLTGKVGRREMWRGFFEEVVDDHSETGVVRQITAYDIGKMLATDEEDFVFKGATFSGMLRSIAAQFEIPLGVVPTTTRVLGNIVGRGEAVWDLIQKGVQRHKDLTGEVYRVLFSGGKMSMILQGSQTRFWIFEVGRSLQNARRRRTIADMENRVKIYGEVSEDLSKPRLEATIENTESQGIYGLRQRVEYVSSADDEKSVTDVARQRIDRRSIPEETIEITGWAVPLLRGGETVRVIDIDLGVSGVYFVESSECSWASESARSVAVCRRKPIDPGLFMDQLVVA